MNTYAFTILSLVLAWAENYVSLCFDALPLSVSVYFSHFIFILHHKSMMMNDSDILDVVLNGGVSQCV